MLGVLDVRSATDWRGSQVVRQRSAKPLFGGSIPPRASTDFKHQAVVADRLDRTLFPTSASSPTDGVDNSSSLFQKFTFSEPRENHWCHNEHVQ